ncbi:NAD(P)-binding protein [Lophium mytilinum]|uniref:NAD(P)-binding protein n=1 Tax=Lophium mytilinum TaxID=390894 RepID=A0A6A6RCQ7_9PEZI|nr:NAD(P)-binding protein [Lophium mytilinum]
MVVVAVAGGSSPAVGRSILQALKAHPKHTPFVLTRLSSATPQWLQDLEIEVRRVDYQSEKSLLSALTGVHTLICTLLAKDGTWASTQIALLHAGLEAGISRFAPAEFGCGPLASPHIGFLAPSAEVLEACREAKKRHPQFEWAGFHVGLFMNYLGYGAPDEAKALAGKENDGTFIFDVENLTADIPLTATGEIPRMSLTEIGDVGRFVAAACDLPVGEWKEEFGAVGETLRMNEIVKLVERVRGRTMQVRYWKLEEINKDLWKVEKGDYLKEFWLEMATRYARDAEGEGIIVPVLNDLCPQVKPIGVEEYLSRFWVPL